MPADYRIVSELNLVHIRLTGEVTEADLSESYEQVRADPAWRPGMNRMFDYSAAERTNIPMQGLRRIGALWARLDEVDSPVEAKVVNVAPDDLLFGVLRQFQVFRGKSDETFRVVRAVDDACAFLGLARSELDGALAVGKPV